MHRRRQGWWFLEAMTTAQADQYPEIRKGSNHIQWVVVFVEKWLYWWPIIIFFLCFNGCSHSSFRTQESFVRCIWCVKTRFCSGGEIPWGFLLDALTPYWVLLAPLFIIKLITRTYMALRYELSIIHALIGLSLLLEDTAAVNEIWKCGAPKVGPLFFPRAQYWNPQKQN